MKALYIAFCNDCLYGSNDDKLCQHPEVGGSKLLNLNKDGKYIPDWCPLPNASQQVILVPNQKKDRCSLCHGTGKMIPVLNVEEYYKDEPETVEEYWQDKDPQLVGETI